MAGVDVPVVPARRQIAVTTPLPEVPPDFPFVIEFARSLYFHREGPGLLTGMSNHDEPVSFNQSVDAEWELVHLEAACQRMPLLEQRRHFQSVGRVVRKYTRRASHPGRGGRAGRVLLHHGLFGSRLYARAGVRPAAGRRNPRRQSRTLDVSSLRLSRFHGGPTAREYNVV